MWTEVSELHGFYRTRLGQMARRLLRRQIRAVWPSVRGLNVLGIGYAAPFLAAFREEAARVVGLMPAPQGVLRWPADGGCLVGLADEADLPLADRSIDRILLVHCVESSEQLRPMLREIWRVLADGGRLLVVVPNRRGIWAQLDRTPFGHGQPYTGEQLDRVLRGNMFAPLDRRHALYIPPLKRRITIASAPAVERLGERWFPNLGGALLVEAGKQLYAATPLATPGLQERTTAVARGRRVGEAARVGTRPRLDVISGRGERSPIRR